MTTDARVRALDGVRVLDLTVAVAGPVATHLLADLGADVIRVEPPFARSTKHLDVAPRAAGAPDRPYNRVGGYNDLQRGKRGITLDLSKPAGRDALLRLVAVSDAVVENMSPRVLPSLGLAYDDLRAVKPDIVLVSMPAFGSTGPLRDRVSFGPGIDAISGLSHLTGYADGPPTNAALYFCDYNAGALAATALLAALRHRDRTGEGQRVELSMLEGELQLLVDALIDYAMNRRVLRRNGNAHATMAPHGVYPCAGDDRWLAVACESDAQWRSLCAVIARDELARHAPYADVVSRVRHHAELDALVSDWTRARDAHEAERALLARGVPARAVQTVADLFADEQLAARRWIQRVEHPEVGAIPHSRPPFTMSATPVVIQQPAPCFGQHNDDVLRGLARLSHAELASLREANIVRDEPPK